MSKSMFICCFCAGILFSTLVFGPACGFILGSLCTKFYVDAIFIDTSEFNISPVLHFCLCFSVHVGYWLLLCLSPQISSASLQKTRDGLGPGGQASSCVVPYSFVQLSWCLVSLSHCRTRRERRRQTVSMLCFLLLWLQTMRLQSPAMGLYATTSLPTAPPAVSNSGVSMQDPIALHCFHALYLSVHVETFANSVYIY